MAATTRCHVVVAAEGRYALGAIVGRCVLVAADGCFVVGAAAASVVREGATTKMVQMNCAKTDLVTADGYKN